MVDQQTVNPAYSGGYTLSFSGKSGLENIVVQLNDQDYMYITFNYDTQEATVTETFEFVPPSSGNDEPEEGENSGSEDGTGGGIQPSGE